MRTLSEELHRRAESAGSVRALSQQTGVSYTGLKNLIDNPDAKPELETLVRFSRAFNLPLWRVVEMAGFDLGFGSASIAQRIASLIEAVPEFQEGLDRLLKASPDDIEGMLAYLEAQSLVRERRAQYDVDK